MTTPNPKIGPTGIARRTEPSAAALAGADYTKSTDIRKRFAAIKRAARAKAAVEQIAQVEPVLKPRRVK